MAIELVKLMVDFGSSPETDSSQVAYLEVEDKVPIRRYRFFGAIRFWWSDLPKRTVYLGRTVYALDMFENIVERGGKLP